MIFWILLLLICLLSDCNSLTLNNRLKDNKEVSQCLHDNTPGAGPELLNLGRTWETDKPFVTITANMSTITSLDGVRSYFQFRTFDPEGIIMYGDGNNATEWFILGLRNGIAEMQIGRFGVRATVSGGPIVNDGEWHLIHLKSEQEGVVLRVDDKSVLRLELYIMHHEKSNMDAMRILLGGHPQNASHFFTPLKPQMDGCLKNWNWLNQDTDWLLNLDVNTKPCFTHISRGSYFSGEGLAVFHSNDFPQAMEDWTLNIEMIIRPDQWQGTLVTITTKDLEDLMTVHFDSLKASELIQVKTGTLELTLPQTLYHKCQEIRFSVNVSEHEIQVQISDLKMQRDFEDYARWKQVWQEGASLFIGGSPDTRGKSPYSGRNYFQGCLGQIRVQNQLVDMDASHYKHDSIWSHSCPQWKN
uniref:Sex hormone-binding globulin n=1 Tax=Erpetoichthys calabaricus TaxID=27687 RepID=A0A8C4SFH2_ERPCA